MDGAEGYTTRGGCEISPQIGQDSAGPWECLSASTVNIDRLNRDLRKVNAKARTALGYFERLELEGIRWALDYFPEMQNQQL